MATGESRAGSPVELGPSVWGEGEEGRAEKVLRPCRSCSVPSTEETELLRGAVRVFSAEGMLAHLHLRMAFFGFREGEARLE